MKNKYVILFTLFLSFSILSNNANAASKIKIASFNNIKNKQIVQSIQDTSFVVMDSTIIKGALGTDSLRYNYTFDSKGLLAQNINQNWNSNSWKNYDMNVYTYDSKGNNTSGIYSIYKSSNSTWTPSIQSTYTFDANNNMTTNINLIWKASSSSWVDSGEVVITYNTNNNPTQSIHYTWNGTTWINESKNTFTYTGNQMTTEIIYTYNGSAWVNDTKEAYTYDANGNISLIMESYYDSKWIIDYRTDFKYDSNHNKLTEYGSWYDDAGINYYDDYEITDIYDSNNNISIENDWTADVYGDFTYYETLYTYDSANNLLTLNNYNQDDKGNNISLNYEIINYYSTKTFTALYTTQINNLQYFPNPVKDKLQLSGITDATTITILDLSGKTLITKTISDNETIMLNNLSNGVYLIKANTNKWTQVSKLLKE